ncbi:MAG: hypothetical protein V1800_17980 [Candidatus Latescibacterota bacterium]
MTRIIFRASVLVILLFLMALPFVRCARNTLGEQYDDGRVYFLIDLNPDWFGASTGGSVYQGYVGIRYTVEGEEPVVSEPYQYPIKDLSGQKFDLVGRSLQGGLEMNVTAVTSQTSVEFYIGVPTFKIDGNVTLRFRLKDKENSTSQLILLME